MGRPNLDSFARFFVIPEAGHGLSGYSFYLNGDGKKIEETELPHQFDSFALLRDWWKRTKRPACPKWSPARMRACRSAVTRHTQGMFRETPAWPLPTDACSPDRALYPSALRGDAVLCDNIQ